MGFSYIGIYYFLADSKPMLLIIFPVLIFSGIYAAIGIHFLCLYYRIPRLRSTHMRWFVITCFIFAVFSGTRVGIYTSTILDALKFWIWASHIMIPVLGIAVTGLFSNYVKDKYKWIISCFYIIYGVFTLGIILGGEHAVIALNSVNLPIAYLNSSMPHIKGDLGIIVMALYGFLIFSILYCLFHIAFLGVEGDKNEVTAMICGALILFATIISDVAVGYELISFIFIGEYGFLFLMITMCYTTVDKIASQWEDASNQEKSEDTPNQEKTNEPCTVLKDMDTASIKNELLILMHEKKMFADENLSLDVVAKHLALSSSKFSKFMNVIMNSDFRNFVNTFRVEEAKKLLTADSDLSIKEICYEVGFKSASTFYDAFKKHTGTSPAKFRKELTE